MLKVIVDSEELKPLIGTEGSAGYDLRISNDIVLGGGQSAKVGTGVKVEIPENHVGLIIPRSSTGKKGIALTNTVGVIDSDYQGEIFLPLVNRNNETFMGYRGDRLMQLLIIPCVTPKIMYVSEFETKTERGEGGFGSTGE